MFCNKCGSQIADGATFCNVCGAPQGAPAARPAATPAYGYPAAPRPAGALKFRTPDFRDKKVLFYIIAAGLILIAFILSLMKVVTVSVFGMTEAASLGECERGAAVAFVIIFSILALAACAMLVLFDMPDNIRKILAIAAPACAFLALLIFLIGFWSFKGEYNREMNEMMREYAEYGNLFGSIASAAAPALGVAGWFCIVFFAGALGLTGYLAFDELKPNKAPAAYNPAPRY